MSVMEMIKPKQYVAELSEVKEIAPEIKLFTFNMGEEFKFKPGQFVIVEWEEGKEVLKRAYSVCSSGKSKEIKLCMNIVPGGKFTPKLNSLSIGGKIFMNGPHGFFGKELSELDNEIVFIATGTGIAPLKSMLNSLFNRGFNKKITLLYGFRYAENFLFKEELEKLAKNHSNFELVTTVSRPKSKEKWQGNIGRVTNLLDKYSKQNIDYYICGLGDMVKDIKTKLLENGIERTKIHVEAW